MKNPTTTFILAAAALLAISSIAFGKPPAEKRKNAHRQAAGKVAATVEITLTLVMDGSGVFTFARNGLSYTHRHWSPPTQVMINGKPWREWDESPAAWTQVMAEVDVSRAWIVKRAGRDIIGLETAAETAELFIADSPNGAGEYSVTLIFPRLVRKFVPAR